MTSRQYYVALAVLAVTGLAGGGLGNWLFSRQMAFAQAEAANVITARAFRVVNEEGRQNAILGSGGDIALLRFFDEAGKAVMGIGRDQGVSRLYLGDARNEAKIVLDIIKGSPRILLVKETGEVIWKAP